MAKKPIYCCIECGRDTTRDCKVCKTCMPLFHRSNSKTEQIGRSALPLTAMLDDSYDESRAMLRYDLR